MVVRLHTSKELKTDIRHPQPLFNERQSSSNYDAERNCNLEFPSLETLSLVDCPEMQTFSSAFVRTPKLNTVILNHSKEQWKGDLNSTVQHLFQEKGMLKSDIKSDWEDEEEVEEDEDEEEIDDDDDDDEIGDDNDDEELEEEVEKEENTTA
ncbi:hypothetical protein L1049_001225 [Liquidambar formosana]|uniref:Uncharacterized protein n=1 Tax=Liquidambar formosana TaxID=63359 RepID=A0AAP0NCG1_LIQFO